MRSSHVEYGSQISYDFYRIGYENCDSIDFANFNCENDHIDDFIKSRKFTNTDNGVTYGFVEKETNRLIAFATLNCCGIRCVMQNNYAETLPTVEIKYFALDHEFHGLQYEKDDEDPNYTMGKHFLMMVINEINNIASQVIGANCIIIYSVPKAENFYQSIGLKAIESYMERDNRRMIRGCVPMYSVLR